MNEYCIAYYDLLNSEKVVYIEAETEDLAMIKFAALYQFDRIKYCNQI